MSTLAQLDTAGALETLESIRPQLERVLAMVTEMSDHLEKSELESALTILWALKTARGELEWGGPESSLRGAIEHLATARDAAVDVLISMASMIGNRSFEAGDWEDAAQVLRGIWLASEEVKGASKEGGTDGTR